MQVERRKKADQLEKGKVSKAIRRLREEISDLEDQKQQIGEQQSALKTSGDSNGFQMLDGRISELEKEPHADHYNVRYRYCRFFSSNLYGNEHADSGSGSPGGNCGSACLYGRD